MASPRRKARRSAAAAPVRLDYTGCLQEAVGPAGLTADELAAGLRRGDEARARLRAAADAGRLGFDAILDDDAPVAASRREGRRLARMADTLVVDGIGGSALGALALQTALRPKRRLVVLDNVDPEGVAAKLAGLDPKRTAVNVITKSGSTAETMANFLVLLGWMKRALGPAPRHALVRDHGPEEGRPAGGGGAAGHPDAPGAGGGGRPLLGAHRRGAGAGRVPRHRRGRARRRRPRHARALLVEAGGGEPRRGGRGAAARAGHDPRPQHPGPDAVRGRAAAPRRLVPAALGGEPGQARGPLRAAWWRRGRRRWCPWAPPTSTPRSSSTWRARTTRS